MLVDAVTHLYTYPAALEDPGKRAEIATALASLQAELETRGKLHEGVELRVDESGCVLIPDVGPDDVFDALTVASPDWGDHGLFVPRGADE
jgi:hypothetical protein